MAYFTQGLIRQAKNCQLASIAKQVLGFIQISRQNWMELKQKQKLLK